MERAVNKTIRGPRGPYGPRTKIRRDIGVERGWNRSLFDKNYGEGASDRLASLLDKSCNGFKHIGQEFGLTRERIRQIAKMLNPAMTGHVRQKVCALSRGPRLYHRRYPWQVLLVWRLARQAGLVIQSARGASHYSMAWKLVINGLLCRVSSASIAKPTTYGKGNLGYYRARWGGSDETFLIIVAGQDKDRASVFVIPASLIQQHVRQGRNLYIPEREPRRDLGQKPGIEWREFKDRWDLLRPIELTEVVEWGRGESVERQILNLPWRLVVTATGGVVLDAARREVAFCDRDEVEQMRAGIERLNQQGGVPCQSGESEKSEHLK